MATSPMSKVIQNLRRAAFRRDGAGLTDGALLESFITGREEAAFEALVRRHGPMVLGVCRRILRPFTLILDTSEPFNAAPLSLSLWTGEAS
jgi:hypothetical protein